jgi:hypothetical protein
MIAFSENEINIGNSFFNNDKFPKTVEKIMISLCIKALKDL